MSFRAIPPPDIGRELKFTTGGDVLYRGQWDGYINAYDSRDTDYELLLGRLDYQSWRTDSIERYRIKYIEVMPIARRRGIATRLYAKLFKDENITIDDLEPTSLTPEGAAFRRGARFG